MPHPYDDPKPCGCGFPHCAGDCCHEDWYDDDGDADDLPYIGDDFDDADDDD